MEEIIGQAKHYKIKIIKHKRSKIQFILSVLSYALFIWLMLIGLTMLIYTANIKIKQLKGDNTPPALNAYVVLTGSMLPEIQIKDVVLTKKVPPEKLKKGDIITFISSDQRFPGVIVTHRIVDIIHDSQTGTYQFQSKGDNNNVEDLALVEEYNIIGKVIFKIPKIGYIQEFIASKGGLIFVVLIPSLIVLSYDIMKCIKKRKNKKSEKIGDII